MTLDKAKLLIRLRTTALQEFNQLDDKRRKLDVALQTAAFIDEYNLREEFEKIQKDCCIEVGFGFEWPSEGHLYVFAPNATNGTYDDLRSDMITFMYYEHHNAPTVEEVGKILNDPR